MEIQVGAYSGKTFEGDSVNAFWRDPGRVISLYLLRRRILSSTLNFPLVMVFWDNNRCNAPSMASIESDLFLVLK